VPGAVAHDRVRCERECVSESVCGDCGGRGVICLIGAGEELDRSCPHGECRVLSVHSGRFLAQSPTPSPCLGAARHLT
jgi:hypothetical protein